MRCSNCNYDLAGLPSSPPHLTCPECGQQGTAVEPPALKWTHALTVLTSVAGPWIPVVVFALFIGPGWLGSYAGIVLQWLAPITAGLSLAASVLAVRVIPRGTARTNALRLALSIGFLLHAAMISLSFLCSVVLFGMDC